MATDSTKSESKATSKTDETAPEATKEEQQTDAAEATSKQDLGKGASADETPQSGSTDDSDNSDDADLTPTPVARRGGGLAAGAGAIVSAGLGLCSLTGTSLGEMFRERKQLLGQIEASSGGGDQVNALYGAPWHAAAMINSIFALIAVVLGGLLVLQLSGRSDARGWVRVVALGGAILGFIGLLVGVGMYFDLFISQPSIPGAGG